jgi:hypothetical protein
MSIPVGVPGIYDFDAISPGFSAIVTLLTKEYQTP